MVLELARLGAVDRPVPGVVHARRELVREQLPADVEQLDREHADVAELVEELRRDLLGLALRRIRARGARDGEDPAAVLVLGERIEGGLAVAPRTATIDSSRSNATSPSASSSSPSDSCDRTMRWPLPS